jgi:hypothetical protein
MKIKVWSNTLRKYLPSEEWYINSNIELFFEDIMEGHLTKAPKGSYTVIIEEQHEEADT